MANFKHLVLDGENLSAIARRYGTTVQKIATDNHIADPDLIRVSEELLIDLPDAGTNADAFLHGYEGLAQAVRDSPPPVTGYDLEQLEAYCDQVLEQVYQSLLSRVGADVKPLLQTAHATWIELAARDKQWRSAILFAPPFNATSSSAPWVNTELARAELYQARIMQLFEFLGLYDD